MNEENQKCLQAADDFYKSSSVVSDSRKIFTFCDKGLLLPHFFYFRFYWTSILCHFWWFSFLINSLVIVDFNVLTFF